jgi:hypothetical protein
VHIRTGLIRRQSCTTKTVMSAVAEILERGWGGESRSLLSKLGYAAQLRHAFKLLICVSSGPTDRPRPSIGGSPRAGQRFTAWTLCSVHLAGNSAVSSQPMMHISSVLFQSDPQRMQYRRRETEHMNSYAIKGFASKHQNLQKISRPSRATLQPYP